MTKIEEFVMKYYRLENDIFFNQVHDTSEAVFTFSENIKHSFWNHAYPYNISNGGYDNINYRNFLRDVISFYMSKNRNPAIYIDDRYFNTPLLELLYQNKFERFDDEAWMKLVKLNKDNLPEEELTMKAVDDNTKLDDFSKVLNNCFDKEYSEEIKNDFGKVFGFKKVEHFTFYTGKTLVGCVSLFYDKKDIHIHNVGVLSKHQGKGYGKLLVVKTCEYIKNYLKINNIYLQCDGFTLENFYKKAGFETFYRRYGYVFKVKN